MENTVQMSQTEMVLAKNPIIAFISLFMGIISPFLTAIVLPLQVLSLLLAIVIALLTIEARIKERKMNSKKPPKKNQHHESQK